MRILMETDTLTEKYRSTVPRSTTSYWAKMRLNYHPIMCLSKLIVKMNYRRGHG